MTDGQRKHDQFLEKASDADAEALRTTDAILQVSWRRIAENYRALARCEGLLNRRTYSYFRVISPPTDKETTPN